MARRCPMAHAKILTTSITPPIQIQIGTGTANIQASGSLTAAAGRFLISDALDLCPCGMLVSDTERLAALIQISSEHHVHNEIEVRNAAHWSFMPCRLKKNGARRLVSAD